MNEPANAGALRVLLFGRATAMSKISCSIATALGHRTRFRFNTEYAIALPNQRVPSNGFNESAPKHRVNVHSFADALPIKH